MPRLRSLLSSLETTQEGNTHEFDELCSCRIKSANLLRVRHEISRFLCALAPLALETADSGMFVVQAPQRSAHACAIYWLSRLRW